MADNLEPINIDINMRQNVSDESDKATQSMDNLAESSSATIAAMEKDIARQVEVIKKMTLVIEDLQSQIAANPDVFTDDQVRKISEANQSLSQTQKELETYASTTASMSEAISNGADVTDLMNERTQDLSGTEERLKETMTDILQTQTEVNEGMSENTETTESNTQSTTANTIANQLMSTTVREICSALGIENTAIVQAISSTRTLTTVKSMWTNATRLLNTQLGISIALSKALVASGIGLLLVGIAAVVYAYNNWDEATRNQKAAEEQLNKILEESADRKSNLESKTKSLISIINSETKTIEERIVAYNELQNIYPKVLESLDMHTFKVMGATEQQKLLNQAIYDMDVTHIEGELTKYKKQLADLNGDSFIKSRWSQFQARGLLGQGVKEYLTTGFFDVQEQISNTVDLLEKQSKKQEEIAREAEFLKKPESERREILTAQLEELVKQKEALDQNSAAAQSFANQTDNTTTSVVQLGDKAASVTDNIYQWNKQPDALKNIFAGANFEASILQANIAKIQGQINQIDGIGSAAVVKNKEYFEKQVKDFKALEASIDSKTLSILKAGKDILPSQMITSPEEYNRLKSLQEDYKKLGDRAKEANKELKVYDSGAKTSKNNTHAQNLIKAQDKQARQRVRTAEDLEIQINEAEIKAMDEGSKKVLAQMELNYKKEKMALDRQKEDALKAKKENARAIFEAGSENKGKTFDDSSIKLTEEELKKYQDLQTKNTESFEKDKFKLELQYMREYINEYGTFQQKKLLIAQEYDKKIAASNNEWEKKSLKAQKQTAMANIDFEAVNKKIDWQIVFGNMTGMLQSQLKETLSGLKDYVKTDQFRASSDTDKKTIYEAIEKLRNAMPGGQGTLNFNVIRQQMDDLGLAINELQAATVNERTAYEALSKAQHEYEKALESGNQDLIDSSKAGLSIANNAANQASIAYKDAETNVENLGNTFKQTSDDTVDGLNLVADGLNGFAANSLPQIFKGLQNTITGLSKLNIGGQVGSAISSFSETLSDAGTIAQIISAILSILDILKEGIGTLISSLIDTVLNAVDGILSNILSGKIVTQIADSLKNGIENILNTVSFGGFGSLLSSINGGNEKETAETISRLTNSNEALKVSVDALKAEMAGSNGAKSIQAYNEAVDAQKRYNENLRNILNAQMGYHSSHHSNSYYWDLDTNSLKEVNKLLDTNLNNSWGDFSKLTADQMNQIRTHLPDIWSEMINQGKYGDRFKDDWNNYADQAGKIEDLTDSLRENIAQISFSSLRDSFVNALMDMDADAQDFASNFEEYMTKALLNFAIGDLLDDDLKKWYESWTDSMNDQQGKLTESQIEDYRNQWDAMVQDALDKRDEIASLTGYTGKNNSGRTGSSKGVATASQDSINELNGGIYALRQQVGDIRNLDKESVAIQKTQQASLDRIAQSTEASRDYLREIKRDINTLATGGIKIKDR